MDSFVAAVDEPALPDEIVKKVTEALAAAGFADPAHLAGTSVGAVDKLVAGLEGPAGGLAKRTFLRAEDASAAKRLRAMPLAGQPVPAGSASSLGHHIPNPLAGSLVSLLGPEASAGAVARALSATTEAVDLEGKLRAVSLGNLPIHLRAQQPLFQLLAADNKVAGEANPPRKAFTYVDITHKDLLHTKTRTCCPCG